MAHRKPQYLTPEGFVRTTVNPLKKAKDQLQIIKDRKKRDEEILLASKLSEGKLKPLKKIGVSVEGGEPMPLQRKKISPEAAKAIAAAISGMLRKERNQ